MIWYESCWQGVKRLLSIICTGLLNVIIMVLTMLFHSTHWHQVHENKEELKAKLKELIREKADVFNSKDKHEEDKVWIQCYLFISNL